MAPARKDGELATMPMRLIKWFRLACWLASTCAILLAAVVLGRAWRFVPGGGQVTLFAIAWLWTIAVWMLTPALDDAPARGYARRSGRRRAARFLAFGWPLASSLLLLAAIGPKTLVGGMNQTVLTWAAGASALAGVAGLVALALLLQDLADWARDRTAEPAFNVAVWGVVVASLLLAVGGRITIVAIIGVLCWLGGLGAFLVGLFSLSGSVTWSVVHARERADRARRRDRREQERQRELGANVDRMDRTGGEGTMEV
jgi:hypothetical protein